MRHTFAASLVALVAMGAAREAGGQGTSIVPGATDPVTNVGTRGANWLHIGVGARPQGLGNAAIASAEGPVALFWNPASIVTREGIGAFVSHMELYGNSGITTSAGALTLPIGAGAVGISVQQFSSGDMMRTTERAPNGDDPVLGGSFRYTGIATGLHYARNITDRFAASAGLRYAQEGIDMARTSFVGFDVSTRFRTGLYGLSLGGSVQNIGSVSRWRGSGVDRAIFSPRDNGNATGRTLPVTFTTREIQMPTVFRLGVLSSLVGDAEALFGANERHSLVAEGAFADATDGPLQPAVGVEYGFRKRAFLRTGKKFFNEKDAPWGFEDGLSFGGGLRVPIVSRNLQIDYAYVNMGELRSNQVFSFDLSF